jgi:hypothetical protein
MRMSNSTVPSSKPPVLAEIKPAACQLVPAAAGESAPRDAQLPLRTIGRPDSLTAQRIEVALVLNAMLGAAAATDYLGKHGVDQQVVLRVLGANGRRRGSHDASGIRT